MKEKFEQLITRLCSLSGLPSPKRLIDGDPIEIDGVVLSLVYAPKKSPDLLFVYVDYGPAGPDEGGELYHELLQENFLWFPMKGPAFTVSSATGNVVYVEHFHLDRITAEELMKTLDHFVAAAKGFRSTFVRSIPTRPPVARGRHPHFLKNVPPIDGGR